MSKTKFHYRTNIRAQWWQPKQYVTYFITINTNNKNPCFGHIRNHKMCLTEEGAIAYKYWNEIPIHFPFISLDEFVVMPDHLHGILIINCEELRKYCDIKGTTSKKTNGKDLSARMTVISPEPGSISTVIRSFKGAVRKIIRKNNPDFAWQPLFFDRIIRNLEEFQSKRTYIINNIDNWQAK